MPTKIYNPKREREVGEKKKRGGDARPGARPVSHRDTRVNYGRGYLGEFYYDVIN